MGVWRWHVGAEAGRGDRVARGGLSSKEKLAAYGENCQPKSENENGSWHGEKTA